MSAIEERSPKRRRLSYSPASPPLQEAKDFTHDHALHTPPPSVHMSPSWQTQSLPGIGAGDSTIPPTPSSTSATFSQIRSEGIAETPSGDAAGTQRDIEMADSEHRRSDHERIHEALDPMPPPPLLYKSDHEPIAPLEPNAAHNLIEMYSLQALQASVARRDPQTGEKINKLRKSYETKSRNLGVEGRNKATAQEGHLQGFVDPLWDAEVSDKLTMWDQKMEHVHMDGVSTDELLASLDNAFRLRPGRLPRAEHADWRQQLGLDDTAVNAAAKDIIPPKAVDNSLPFGRTGPSRPSVPASPNGALRPDRAGKKRRYDESSYEGYDDDGYSTGGGRANGARRVKRKVSGF